MTKELRRLSIVMLFMFISLFAATSWIQVVEADTLAQNTNNQRTLLDSYEIQRGSIIVDDVAIASSTPSDDTLPVPARLHGRRDVGAGHRVLQPRSAVGDRHRARDERRPLRHRVQRVLRRDRAHPLRAAADADSASSCRSTPRRRPRRTRHSQGLKGAVVAIEPKTGRILAMVVDPRVRHEPARDPRCGCRERDLRPARRRPDQAAVEPGDRRRPQPPGLDVQARRRRGRLRERRLDAGLDAAEPGHATRSPARTNTVSRTPGAARAAAATP